MRGGGEMRHAFIIAVWLLAALPVAAVADPLPSWNDGPAKAAIVEFVDAVTAEGGPGYVPPAERIAVFDNDGTLWAEQPMYVQLAFALMSAQPLLDVPLHQDEQANSDEKPRPCGGREEVGFVGERSKGVPDRNAQHQRHAPGQCDEHRGPGARTERILAQQAESFCNSWYGPPRATRNSPISFSSVVIEF